MAPADSLPDPVKLRWAWRGVFGLLAATLVVLMVMPWVTTDYDAYHRAAGRVDRGEPLYRMDELGFWHAREVYARRRSHWGDKCFSRVCFFAPTFCALAVSRRHQIVVCARAALPVG